MAVPIVISAFDFEAVRKRCGNAVITLATARGPPILPVWAPRRRAIAKGYSIWWGLTGVTVSSKLL